MPPQNQIPSTTTSNGMIKIVVAILVVAVIGFALWQMRGVNTTPEAVTTNTNTPTGSNTGTNPATGTETPTAPARSKYEDGTYSAVGNYTSPAGTETVTVSLTLKDDVITDATFVGGATHPTSKMVQGKFAEGFKQAVVGKSLDELSLTVVNGSSLTPKGFMDAVAKIKVEAAA